MCEMSNKSKLSFFKNAKKDHQIRRIDYNKIIKVLLNELNEIKRKQNVSGLKQIGHLIAPAHTPGPIQAPKQ